MLHLLRRAAPLAAAITAVLVIQGAALAAGSTSVSIINFAFQPTPAKVSLGGTVTWTNNGSVTHSSCSDGCSDTFNTTGVNLWQSPFLSPGGTFSFTFVTAGSFAYHCSIHSTMHGIINVPMKLPKTGSVGVAFRVTWATADPGSDFEFNIQKANPGGSFQPWMTGVSHTVLFAKFTPSGAGVYKFRAQLQRISTGVKSGFSPAKKITVS